jgi:catechol 2,3-dioxygenase-like lactoylglutathione lyase family enzyme
MIPERSESVESQPRGARRAATEATMATMGFRAGLLALITANGLGSAAYAELAAPNAAGVAMGHLQYLVRDVAANKAFWQKLGGEPVVLGTTEGVAFPDVIVLLRQGEPAQDSAGSVVDHVAFRVQSLAAIEAAGFDVRYNEQFPGVAYVFGPEGERVELFDDTRATNLGFTIDGGGTDTAAERHNRKIDVPIIAHHIHLYVPEADIAAAKEWYAATFGGVRGKRWRYDAVDLPGINLNFSASAAVLAPTRGRRLDHIGFEVENLEAFCRKLEAQGVQFDRPYAQLPSGLGVAFLTDPWGTTIELTEGLREL